jgi:hypothetical protein
MSTIKDGYIIYTRDKHEGFSIFENDKNIICLDKNGNKLSEDENAELFAKYDGIIDIESY